MKRIIVLLMIFLTGPLLADGLLVPQNDDYPQEFLKHRLTHVEVNIHGLVAETQVIQEFVNESEHTVDAVYSFPLPPDARATEFLYWYNDQVYKAVLKVQEQAPNPGTGQGGVIARVNKYIGRNGIKVALKEIPPGQIQKVKLYYVSHLDYYAGDATYRFPLGTGEFVKHPLDHLQVSVDVQTNSNILSYESVTHPDLMPLIEKDQHLHVEMIQPKAYIDKDFEFSFRTQQEQMGVDFYSVANDSVDGHFVLHVRPQNSADASQVLAKRVIFAIGNSSNMFGYKLEQSIEAVTTALGLLNESDEFNILVYNYGVSSWNAAPQPATTSNIQNARQFVESIHTSSGSRMDVALETALAHITDDQFINSIIVLTDGRSPIDPQHIESINLHNAGIFPIGIGDDLDRARLEMTAALNCGFVTYFDETDYIKGGVVRLFEQISQPILKDVALEFGRADLHDILPTKYPTAYAGSYFFLTGRYGNPSESALALAGTSVDGVTSLGFNLDFTSETHLNKFAEHMWAKEKIDALEREVEIYGETPELREHLIQLSLQYNIRCRYTAYVADYKTMPSAVQTEKLIAVPHSYLIKNYPNPFNPSTTISFYIAPDDVGTVKLIKIYNALGRLVAVFDVSHLGAGQHDIRFDGMDFYGNALPSGHYFVRLQVGQHTSTLRVLLMK